MPKVLLVKGVVILALVTWLPTAAAQVADEVVARGSWQVSKPSRDTSESIARLGAAEDRSWSARAKVSRSKELSGPITIRLGGETVSAELRGRMTGGRAWGDVIDAEGRQVASFTGVYGPGGWSGTFTSSTDDQGTWEWDGQPATE
jgi:hypothetical protein